jgi:predicted enzyme related to lactoylglutathione lyase
MIHVADVSLEECLERIVAAGGAVEVPVTAVAEKGRFARFCDPEATDLSPTRRSRAPES